MAHHFGSVRILAPLEDIGLQALFYCLVTEEHNRIESISLEIYFSCLEICHGLVPPNLDLWSHGV